jgi:hypothetical protein
MNILVSGYIYCKYFGTRGWPVTKQYMAWSHMVAVELIMDNCSQTDFLVVLTYFMPLQPPHLYDCSFTTYSVINSLTSCYNIVNSYLIGNNILYSSCISMYYREDLTIFQKMTWCMIIWRNTMKHFQSVQFQVMWFKKWKSYDPVWVLYNINIPCVYVMHISVTFANHRTN